jgi:hypothetical protein
VLEHFVAYEMLLIEPSSCIVVQFDHGFAGLSVNGVLTEAHEL